MDDQANIYFPFCYRKFANDLEFPGKVLPENLLGHGQPAQQFFFLNSSEQRLVLFMEVNWYFFSNVILLTNLCLCVIKRHLLFATGPCLAAMHKGWLMPAAPRKGCPMPAAPRKG